MEAMFRQQGYDTTTTEIYDQTYQVPGPWSYEGEVLTIVGFGSTKNWNIYNSKIECIDALRENNFVK